MLVGCAGSPDQGASAARTGNGQPVLPDTQTIDGVLVMRHDSTAFARAPRWVLDPKPLVVIGGTATPNLDLSDVWRVAVLSDGRA